MPGTVSDTPTVSLSFANNFWGKDDAGVNPMLERMHYAKVTNDELKVFYSTRAAIEDEYARKLLALCRKPLGSNESGTLRESLDVVRGETEAIGKAHSAIAAQMKTELEEPLAAFAGGMKERRKIVQNGIERLLKIKIGQTNTVNKTRDRYEQDCLRIKGYLAQGHMVMGQEERKNKAKLEKTQIQLASSSNEYEAAVKALEETIGRWNKEWKAGCDKFQDLEEERLDFTKSSLWTYANIASTVCVSDDASCEKIRLSLEGCEVERDISSFISDRGTGQEIPDAPKYINFCRGDVTDTSSEASEEESYSVAQFQRTINPAFRSSSPQPSTYESHHDPSSDLAASMGHGDPGTPASREATVTPQKPVPTQPPAPLDFRRGGAPPPNYEPSQHGEIGQVPHNAYPTDGMTMFCRTGPPSERSSATSANRPSSRDSHNHSDYSNPTSFSSQEPVSAAPSPTKSNNTPAMSPQKPIQKKRSGFFSNSPFRRKSKHEKEHPGVPAASSRNSWVAARRSNQNSPTKVAPDRRSMFGGHDRVTPSPEPVDPRANFQLNVGNNVFDVASPDATHKAASKASANNEDPIARALADLKVAGKNTSGRVSADRYHGISTPAPSASGSNTSHAPPAAPAAATAQNTPPPAYDPSVKRLDAPQPAFTSAQMQKTTRKYVGQTQDMFTRPNPTNARPSTRNGPPAEAPRAVSPSPTTRGSASPRTQPRAEPRSSGQYSRGVSPSPSAYQSSSVNSRYRQSPGASSPQQYVRQESPAASHRAVSPQPQFRRADRPSSAGSMGGGMGGGMELQLSGGQVEAYGGPAQPSGRPMSSYYNEGSAGRSRSRTLDVAQPQRQYSRDGRPIIHFARAMYSYTAAIPEELGFSKGEILAVLRLQDDGWWEAEVTGQRSRPGLVPSNYLQPC